MMVCVICFPLCSGYDKHGDALLIAEHWKLWPILCLTFGNYDPFIHLYAVDKRG
jgi:hypothetical protein